MEYFLLFLIWIAAAFFFPVMLRRFQIPWVTAVIFAGIILGPHGLGIINPGEIMDFLATIGIVFLMFTAGLDIKFSKLKKAGRNVLLFSVVNLCIPFTTYGIEVEHDLALERDIPFLTHCSEGFDPETRQDIKTLDKKGALSDHSVLVHGLSFSEEDIELIKERDSSVVWCADSNMFMYNETTNINLLLETGINVCIGTDSPMSGGLNLLHELKFDRDLYKKLYSKSLFQKELTPNMY